MRRLAFTLALGAALAFPVAAEAHTLSITRAGAAAQQYAQALSAQTWLAQDRGAQVTGCRRSSVHAVDCTFFIAGESEPPLHKVFRCDDAVRVYYAGARSYRVLTSPIGTPSCYAV